MSVLAPSDSDAGVLRCHACWGWFPQDEFLMSPEASLLESLGFRVTAKGRHAASCDGVCQLPDCEFHRVSPYPKAEEPQ